MLKVISGVIMMLVLSTYAYAFSGPPDITYNVTVAQNVAENQCPASWEGQTSPDIVNVMSGLGNEQENTGPVIRSCSNCAIQSGNCVCGTCYDYFN